MSFTDSFSSNSGWVSPAMGNNFPLSMSGWGGGSLAAPAISAMSTSNTASALAPAAPGIGGPAGGMGAGSSGFGFNMDTGKLLLGGLQTIGSIWNAWEAQKLAKKQFAYQKDVTETNLRNQIQAYNTTLADRGRSRAHTEGQDAATAEAYITNNSLKR